MSRNPLHLRDEQDQDHEKPRVEDNSPAGPRDDALERAAKELGVTYEELRSAVEY